MKQSKHKLEGIENSVYANSVVIIVRNARVRQQADQVLIISMEYGNLTSYRRLTIRIQQSFLSLSMRRF